jgi:sugar transferase EpsL
MKQISHQALPKSRLNARRILYRRYIKRALDLALIVLTLPLLLPVLAAVALLVRIRLGKPVIFRQQRPGLHGVPFTLYKFRTMTDERDAEGNLLPDTERLTSLGRFLRASSLDELPELYNVLRGEMSLVGPRPLLMQYLDRYTPQQAQRHNVLPGLTGLAQVQGRNELTWAHKFTWDVRYVNRASLWMDLKILAKTVLQVLKREGIHHPGEATMPEFQGDSS